MQNGYCESFNGRMRDELLNEMLFLSLHHARVEIAARVRGYNQERPHSSLGYETPAAFRSEEHTSELQSLMRISYAVFCLNKKTKIHKHTYYTKLDYINPYD